MFNCTTDPSNMSRSFKLNEIRAIANAVISVMGNEGKPVSLGAGVVISSDRYHTWVAGKGVIERKYEDLHDDEIDKLLIEYRKYIKVTAEHLYDEKRRKQKEDEIEEIRRDLIKKHINSNLPVFSVRTTHS